MGSLLFVEQTRVRLHNGCRPSAGRERPPTVICRQAARPSDLVRRVVACFPTGSSGRGLVGRVFNHGITSVGNHARNSHWRLGTSAAALGDKFACPSGKSRSEAASHMAGLRKRRLAAVGRALTSTSPGRRPVSSQSRPSPTKIAADQRMAGNGCVVQFKVGFVEISSLTAHGRQG